MLGVLCMEWERVVGKVDRKLEIYWADCERQHGVNGEKGGQKTRAWRGEVRGERWTEKSVFI